MDSYTTDTPIFHPDFSLAPFAPSSISNLTTAPRLPYDEEYQQQPSQQHQTNDTNNHNNGDHPLAHSPTSGYVEYTAGTAANSIGGIHPAYRRQTQSLSHAFGTSQRHSNHTFDDFLPSASFSSDSHPAKVATRPLSLSHARTESFGKQILLGRRQLTDFTSQPASMENDPRLASQNGTASPKPRLSDEGNAAGVRARKKSGFSKLVTSMLGSPKPTISAPMNPVHITRVGYDHQTGQFTVSPRNVAT